MLERGWSATVEPFLKQLGPGQVDAVGTNGETALTIVLTNNSKDPTLPFLLLRYGSSPTKGPRPSMTPLAIAASRFDETDPDVEKTAMALVKELASRGAITSPESDQGAEALSGAGGADMVRLLLQLGADPNHANTQGTTPLLAQATRLSSSFQPWESFSLPQYPPLILALIEGGADVRRADASGATALHYCAAAKHVALATALLDHGADVNARRQSGFTPLLEGLQTHDHGPPPDQSDRIRDIVTLLLKRGADPNLGTAEGLTPLTWVVYRPEATRLLLEGGADPRLPGAQGKTALELTNNREVAHLLVAAGAGTATHRLLHRLYLPPKLIDDLAAIGRVARPFFGVLVLFVPPLLFLMAFGASSRLRSEDKYRSRAAGAVFALAAATAYCVAVPMLLILVFDWVAGKVLEAGLPAVTVIAWIVVYAAYRAGRNWHARRWASSST